MTWFTHYIKLSPSVCPFACPSVYPSVHSSFFHPSHDRGFQDLSKDWSIPGETCLSHESQIWVSLNWFYSLVPVFEFYNPLNLIISRPELNKGMSLTRIPWTAPKSSTGSNKGLRKGLKRNVGEQSCCQGDWEYSVAWQSHDPYPFWTEFLIQPISVLSLWITHPNWHESLSVNICLACQ